MQEALGDANEGVEGVEGDGDERSPIGGKEMQALTMMTEKARHSMIFQYSILLEYAIHSFIHSFIQLFYLFLFIHLGFTNLFIFFILFICLSIYSFENGTGKQRKTHTTHTHTNTLIVLVFTCFPCMHRKIGTFCL